jgi:adenosylhomocysteinase
MADSKVKDMGLAEFGRKELTLAEIEMPGLMASRTESGPPSHSRAWTLTVPCT